MEIIEKYFGSFRELLWKIFKIKPFRKISKIILENFEKLSEIFLEISRNINESFESYSEKCFQKCWKISRIIKEYFEIHFIKF